MVWTLGVWKDGLSGEAAAQWGVRELYEYEWGGSCLLFTLRNGRIVKADTDVDFGACGGPFSWCCSARFPLIIMDDKWKRHFDALGMQGDFPAAQIRERSQGR
jgi:hypothetical protein